MLPLRKRVQLEFHDESLTEQEHTDSCDINKMLKRAMAGQEIRTRRPGAWEDGLTDDMSDNLLDRRIRMENATEQLNAAISELEGSEVSEEEYAELQKHPALKNVKVKLRKKQAQTNDDKTTNTNASQSTQNPTPTSTPNPA